MNAREKRDGAQRKRAEPSAARSERRGQQAYGVLEEQPHQQREYRRAHEPRTRTRPTGREVRREQGGAREQFEPNEKIGRGVAFTGETETVGIEATLQLGRRVRLAVELRAHDESTVGAPR